MWFKNLRLYRLSDDFTISPEELNNKLEAFCFNPCGNLDPLRYGFEPPLGRDSTEYVHVTNGYIMVCAKKQEKILPSGVIKEHLEEKISAIREAEGRPVGRKERDTMKDEIIFSLLPKAFTKSSLDYAYIAPQEKLIVVNASSAKRAEDLISKLREALGTLRCVPLTLKHQPIQIMTHWLTQGFASDGFAFGEEAELQATKDGRVVRVKKLDLTSHELKNHLESGMHASKLALIWNESISFILDDQLGIKRLKFDDVISEQANERNPESRAEQFDADFAIMAMELKKFIDALLHAFGGESSPE